MADIKMDEAMGVVILSAAATLLVNFWQMSRIGSLRKSLGIKYPLMYSSEAKHNEFNCAQRVHQNTLEQLPFFLVNVFLASLRHPKWAGYCGVTFIVARILYSFGYYTGDPQKRIPGAALTMLGVQLPLFLMAAHSASGVLGWF